MFEGLSKGLGSALSFINRGRLTEANIREGMRLVRQALLEADVNYDVADQFVERVTEQAVGESVLKSMRPSEQIVGIVGRELAGLMGPVDHEIPLRRDDVTVLMMCGLQGSGKTTTCGKLARLLKGRGAQPMLVAADLQRPAAIEQLRIIGEQIGVPVYSEDPAKSNPVQVCRNGLKEAKSRGDVKVLILDTAGRLHVDDALMKELEQIDNKLQPHQVYLVCDAMTGQDAVNSAKAFNDALELDGVVLTKLDGDTRGGAALSVKEVTGVPIKFIGVGEQLDKLQEFHPERMAQRILGMGDILTLYEEAQSKFDQEEVEQAQRKMAAGKFTLSDFQKQMKQIRRLGSLSSIMKMIPGLGNMAEQMSQMNGADAEQDMTRIDGIISSMTPWERENPDKIDRARRNRIAQGSGSDPADINKLIKDFQGMSGVMQKMAGMGMRDRFRAVNELGPMLSSGSPLQKQKVRPKRGPADESKARELKAKKRKDAKKQRKKNRK